MKEISKKLIQLKGLKIVKNGLNKHQNFKYYLLSDIQDKVIEFCNKNGIFYESRISEPDFEKGVQKIDLVFEYEYTKSEDIIDESYTYTYYGGLDNQQKNPVQSIGASDTYNVRYALMFFLGISDNVDDPDSNDLKAHKEIKSTEKLMTSEQTNKLKLKLRDLSNEEKKELFFTNNLLDSEGKPKPFSLITQSEYKELIK